MGSIAKRRQHLQEIAEPQGGYFTAAQGQQAGYAAVNFPYYVKVGHWRKIDRGLYRLADFPDSMTALCWRWALWSRDSHDQPQLVFCRRTALALHGLAELEPGRIEASVPGAFRKTIPPEVVTYRENLNLSALENREGLLCTRLRRTLEDLRREAPTEAWSAWVARAVDAGRLTPAEGAELAGQGGATLDDPRIITLETSRPAAGPDTEKAELAGAVNDTLAEGVWKMIFSRAASGRSARAGFTLVELLVVVSIISVLAALLLPVLEKSLASARLLKCKSNARQLALTAGLYSDDYGEWLFPNNWLARVLPYEVTLEMLHCPAEVKPTTNIDTVNYGISLDNISGLPPTYWNTPKTRLPPIVARNRASTTVYFMDATGYYVQHIGGAWCRIKWAGARHGGYVHVIWIDQHVSQTTEDRLADSNRDGMDDRSYFSWTDNVWPEPLN